MRKHYWIALMLSALALSGTAQASVIQLNTVFNGSTPASTSPWLSLDFETVSAGTVQLTVSSDLNVASEFIDDVYFNINPTISPASLNIVQTAGQVPAAVHITHTTQNAQNVTGGGAAGTGFDVALEWTTSGANGGVGRFNGLDVVTFLITGSGITASDFDTWTSAGSAQAIAAAHIQGIQSPTGGTTSGAVMNGATHYDTTTPEPATFALLGSAGALVALLRKRLARR